jgi:hypothetical protein
MAFDVCLVCELQLICWVCKAAINVLALFDVRSDIRLLRSLMCAQISAVALIDMRCDICCCATTRSYSVCMHHQRRYS